MKLLNKIFTIAMLFSSLVIAEEMIDLERGHGSFDVRDKNIGFKNSPNSFSDMCLLPEMVIGEDTIIYNGAAVGPSIAVNPTNKKHVVAAWQQDRINNGGGLDIGIARSSDSGKSWHQSLIPLQNCNGGFAQRSSDVWLSYAADGSRVYLTALVLNATEDANTLNQEGIIVTFSQDDGKTWSIPRFVAASGDFLNDLDGLSPVDEKSSVTADPNIPGNAYVVWNRYPEMISSHADTFISRSTNGGLSWSSNTLLYDPFVDLTVHNMSNGIYNDSQTVGNVITSIPGGKLLNFMVRIYAAPGATNEQYINDSWPYQYTLGDIAVVSSLDHGLTWTEDAVQIATLDLNQTFTGGYTYSGSEISGGVGARTRTANILFDVNVNPHNGILYVVWQTGEFRVDQLPQIAISASRDAGFTWSDPVKVNHTPVNAVNPQAFTPSVAITEDGYVGILYHDFRNDNLLDSANTQTDVWFALYKELFNPHDGSTGMGLDFVKEVRISKKSYIMQDGPETDFGIMTNGDYNQVVTQGDDFYAIYVKSKEVPATPIAIIYENSVTDTAILLDSNKQTRPYFSKIDQ